MVAKLIIGLIGGLVFTVVLDNIEKAVHKMSKKES